ncbi:ABC transporter ATP-binding protein [Brevundimonas sp.]|uniref:ABC transporter ATP-binding protein n=1 Tax=Brevundimonas sp. TaxID=1871086 RepID=UPI0019C1DDB3|nr:ABC transporter ATP-binding protein [Brevundimonas sp.]MBD3837163.1 ABC transporter ATP-binding protein [Brevundimonas sp.]
MSALPVEADVGLIVTDLARTYHGSHRPLFSKLNFSLKREGRLAVLGRNGQGKSTLIRMLGGVDRPSAGRIDWRMTASWPIGFGGGFQGSLSGLDNIRFLSRLYGRDYKEALARVDDFAELGRVALRQPVKQYSSGMRARLAFGLSLAIEFDCYLVDELIAVGDARFQRKCREQLFEHRAHRAFLMATHAMELVSDYCDRALIVESGKAKMFDDVDEAIEVYTWLRAA